MTTRSGNALPRLLAVPAESIVTLILFAVAVGLLGEAVETSDIPVRSVVWGGLALGVYAVGLLCLIGARGSGLGLVSWRIGPWTMVWYCVAFGLATLTWSQPQAGLQSQIMVSNVLRALWLVAIGMTVWGIGYLVGPAEMIRNLAVRGMEIPGRRFAGEVRSYAAPWLLYAIGVVARIASTATTGRFGYVGDASSVVSSASSYQQIVGVLTLCAPLAVAAAALQVFRERLPGARITLAVLMVFELAFGAASGVKQNFVIAALALIIPFCATSRRFPRLATFVAALLFLLVVIPFNHAYRDSARGSTVTLSPTEAFATIPGILKQTLASQ